MGMHVRMGCMCVWMHAASALCNVCEFACTRACVYVIHCVHACRAIIVFNVCMYVCMYVYVYVRIGDWRYVCNIYIYIYIYTHT